MCRQDGIDGKDGKPGIDGKDGAPGIDGPQGTFEFHTPSSLLLGTYHRTLSRKLAHVKEHC